MSESTTTATLTEWLLACIAEDEAVAQRSTDPDDERDSYGGYSHNSPHEAACGYGMGEFGYNCTCTVPAHVLAICGAHRRIVELHTGETPVCIDGYRVGLTHKQLLHGEIVNGVPSGYCDTLRALAAIHSGRDGFREEWR